MTLSERCENFYENNKFDEIIEKFKDAFYNYDWENLDGDDIFKYQRNTGSDKCRHVILRMVFLREIATLANISDDFKLNSLFLNTLVEQGMIDSYDFGNNDGMDAIKINIEEYERNKTSYIHFKEVTETIFNEDTAESIEDEFEENAADKLKNSMNEENPLNNKHITGYLSNVSSELTMKSIWNEFYNNDKVIMRPHIHNLIENPKDVPTKKSCDGVLLFVLSIPGNRNIVTFPGYYDENNDVWKRSCNDATVPKEIICGWADFQIYEKFQLYEKIAESKMDEEKEIADSDETAKNLRRITRHRTTKEAKLYRKSVWDKFYNKGNVKIRLAIHNLMEDPNDVPDARYGDIPVILFVFSIPNGENIITLPGWYDNEHDMWKRSSDDLPIEKYRICGWAYFQKYENVAELKIKVKE